MSPPAKPSRRPIPRPRTAPRRIRIIVADDQPIDRRALVALLATQPDFEIVADAATGHEAASQCKRLRPDVVIMSTGLPDQGGISAVSFIRAAHAAVHVIALAERGTAHCLVLNPPGKHRLGLPTLPEPLGMCTDCLQLAISEGALGALRRDVEPEQFYRAVRTVAEGNAWYEPGTASAMMRVLGPDSKNGAKALSSRELEVAGLISDGRSKKEIGKTLGISEPTVKKHVGHVLAKLQLQDRLQIGIYVVRNPLLLGDKGRKR